MAKKKGAIASPFVPAEEQPYPIPENWCWVHMGDVFHLQAGKNISAKEIQSEKDAINKYPCFGGNGIRGYVNKYNHDGLYPIIGRQGALCGNINLASGKFYATEHAVPVTCKSIIDKMWAYYALRYSDLNQYATATAQPGLAVSNIVDVPIAIPPFSEQRRIVDRIESLFAKLDEAKEKAQAVVDGFELRKSAILHKAFTGELTEQWRKEHGVGLDSWKHYTVGDVCNDVKVGIVIKPSQYYTVQDEGTPAFRSANVRECRVDDFDWVYLNEEGMTNNKRSIVHTGDVLVVRSGNPGTACVVSEKFDGYNAIDILIAVPNQELILSDFLCLFTNSPLGKKSVTENKRGMALAHFNVKGYSKVEFDVPPIAEQKEIIKVLDALLEKEQQAREAAESVLTQIDTMKKAILARAFRGELGTNDPAEESAAEFLTQCFGGGEAADGA